MKEIFDAILKKIEVCSNEHGSFDLPHLKDCEITESEYSSGGTTLFGKQYDIKKGNEVIIVTYESKDKCRTFQIKPDLNTVNVKLLDKNAEVISNYSKSWEDKI